MLIRLYVCVYLYAGVSVYDLPTSEFGAYFYQRFSPRPGRPVCVQLIPG